MYYLAGLFSETADEFDILMLQVCLRCVRVLCAALPVLLCFHLCCLCCMPVLYVCASICAACAVCLCFHLCLPSVLPVVIPVLYVCASICAACGYTCAVCLCFHLCCLWLYLCCMSVFRVLFIQRLPSMPMRVHQTIEYICASLWTLHSPLRGPKWVQKQPPGSSS